MTKPKRLVHDTGMGMDEPTKERIFEPFFTTKERGKGTGLGLATAYGVVKQSGGEIEVDTEPGRGTTFRIYFPTVAAFNVVEPDVAAPSRPAETGHETILIAEDEPALRHVAARVLQRSGYTTLEASNGEEALRVAEQHNGRIHLLLSDVVMPLMGGWELAERFTARYPGIPVLHMSGYAEDESREISSKTPLLQKPFDLTVLVQAVRDMLDGRVPDV